MEWIVKIMGLYGAYIYLAIVLIITILIVLSVFRNSKLLYIIFSIIFVLTIMFSSLYINLKCDQKIYKAIFNMYAIFFTIDVDIDNLEKCFELPYYIVKSLAILSTFYLIIFEVFGSLNKIISIIIARIRPNKYILYFTDDANRKYIQNHGNKNLVEIEKFNKFFSGKKYLIAYDNDQKNLNFYANNKDKLSNKQVAIVIKDLESSLFTEKGYNIVNFYEIIARNFWLNECDLFEIVKQEKEVTVCLIGLDIVGRNILKFALLNNLFFVDQKITYKVWGDKDIYDTLDIDLESTSNDRIMYMGDTVNAVSDLSIEDINSSHMCVISEWDQFVIQEIISRAFKCNRIWIYDESEMSESVSELFVPFEKENDGKEKPEEKEKHRIDFFGKINIYLETLFKNIKLKLAKLRNAKFEHEKDGKEKSKEEKKHRIEFFGKINIDDEILFKNNTLKLAKLINAKFKHENDDGSKKNKSDDDLWDELNVYKRKSSIACAQYDAVRKKYLVKKDENQKYYEITEDMKILEHTRWCRFMLLDDWKYGKTRNDENKLHIDLVPYDELIGDEKNKDEKILNYLNNEVNIEKEEEEKCWKICLIRKILRLLRI